MLPLDTSQRAARSRAVEQNKELGMTKNLVTSSASSGSSLRAQLDNAPVRMIDIGSASIAYRKIGSGPDLVFVHGWPLDSNTFRDLAPRLAGSFTCHLFDLPGAGASVTKDPKALRLSQHPESLRAVVDALGLTRYALLAHDSGGYAARRVAAEDPRVSALVLGDTEVPHEVATVIRALAFATRLPLGRVLLRQMMKLRFVRRSPLGFAGCFRDLDHLDGEFHQLFVAPLLESEKHADEVMETVRTIDFSLFDALPAVHARISAPTFLIWGSDDPIFPLAHAREMVPQFGGGATLYVIDGGKAFAHEEDVEEFAEQALAFLRAQHLGVNISAATA